MALLKKTSVTPCTQQLAWAGVERLCSHTKTQSCLEEGGNLLLIVNKLQNALPVKEILSFTLPQSEVCYLIKKRIRHFLWFCSFGFSITYRTTIYSDVGFPLPIFNLCTQVCIFLILTETLESRHFYSLHVSGCFR